MENASRQWYYEVGAQRVGPVPWDELVRLVGQGVLGPQVKVFTDGWGGWLPAAQVPGLPVMPSQFGTNAGERMLLPVGRAPMAIVAGYLGLFSMLGVFAPFAVVTGVLALRTLKQRPELHGAGRAWFGIVMGALFSAVYAWALTH
ncbi:MAG: DUF4339 domain-containing protein [Deltaproteobacteria bacterium]|nr:DUF4339 domain-containing protein [Deltaproteobacteria bacterium]